MEWLASFQIMLWGLILLRGGDTFDTSPAYNNFKAIASEDFWGVFMFCIGAARIVGLIVNGARQDITPWIRATGAFVGFLVFLTISLSLAGPFLAGQPPITSLAMYGPAIGAELAAIYYSVQDAKAYRDGRRTT